MDIIRAIDIIDRHEQDVESYHEMLADLGSSYFYGGAQGNNGYDALTLACNDLGPAPSYDHPEYREALAVVAHFEIIAPAPVVRLT
jgi:hypothetical protein